MCGEIGQKQRRGVIRRDERGWSATTRVCGAELELGRDGGVVGDGDGDGETGTCTLKLVEPINQKLINQSGVGPRARERSGMRLVSDSGKASGDEGLATGAIDKFQTTKRSLPIRNEASRMKGPAASTASTRR
jgi:hypothetical protein